VKQKGFGAVAPLVPHLVRRVVEQAAAEGHAAEIGELAGALGGAALVGEGGTGQRALAAHACNACLLAEAQ